MRSADRVLRAAVCEGPGSMVVVGGAGAATLVEANENSFVYSRKAVAERRNVPVKGNEPCGPFVSFQNL